MIKGIKEKLSNKTKMYWASRVNTTHNRRTIKTRHTTIDSDFDSETVLELKERIKKTEKEPRRSKTHRKVE